MRVVSLKLKNFLGVKSAEIKPGQYVVFIEGKNGAGKSSVFSGLLSAIGGKSVRPKHPIRNGESEATSLVDLGEITVALKITEKGEYLDLRNKEGLKYDSPQQVLDSFYTKVSFDPQAFIDMKPAARRGVLLELTGQKDKLEQFEIERKATYDKRTSVNHMVKNYSERLKALPHDALEPVETTSSVAILTELREEQSRVASLSNRREQAIELRAEIKERQGDIENNDRRRAEYEEAIAKLEKESLDYMERICKLNDLANGIEQEIEAAAPDRSVEIEAELSQVEGQNDKARHYQDAVKLKDEHEKVAAESDALTKKIDKLDADRVAILADSALPIKDLTFDGETMMVGGIPFEDRSTSEKLRIATKVGIATNPKLRVMPIRNGNAFDDDGLRELYKIAEEEDVQFWVEYVSDKAVRGYLMEAGEITSIAAESLKLF